MAEATHVALSAAAARSDHSAAIEIASTCIVRTAILCLFRRSTIRHLRRPAHGTTCTGIYLVTKGIARTFSESSPQYCAALNPDPEDWILEAAPARFSPSCSKKRVIR